MNLSGTFSLNGNRHCPSVAIQADKRFPSASSSTNEVGLSNSLSGPEKKNHQNRKSADASNTLLFTDLNCMIYVECCVLNVVFYMLDVECCMLNVGFYMLDGAFI